MEKCPAFSRREMVVLFDNKNPSTWLPHWCTDDKEGFEITHLHGSGPEASTSADVRHGKDRDDDQTHGFFRLHCGHDGRLALVAVAQEPKHEQIRPVRT